jgi:hypothetical protein
MMSTPELNLRRETQSGTYARPFPTLLNTSNQSRQHTETKKHAQLRKMFMVVMVRVRALEFFPWPPRRGKSQSS